MKKDIPPCEICGDEAHSATRDIRECKPVMINGQLWADWAPASAWRYRCFRHPRPSYTYRRGTNPKYQKFRYYRSRYR